ncbi:hypothetical protein A3Q56_04275 [Intoshia linei]|uniref:BAR domain-containing protein n=1 Tax=Intoshia linei TaxID=1819745 RepID=A0A177B1B1_9BILA|nr:hypothetical protein A3Q56_04275 [Intoshia linei]
MSHNINKILIVEANLKNLETHTNNFQKEINELIKHQYNMIMDGMEMKFISTEISDLYESWLIEHKNMADSYKKLLSVIDTINYQPGDNLKQLFKIYSNYSCKRNKLLDELAKYKVKSMKNDKKLIKKRNKTSTKINEIKETIRRLDDTFSELSDSFYEQQYQIFEPLSTAIASEQILTYNIMHKCMSNIKCSFNSLLTTQESEDFDVEAELLNLEKLLITSD